MKKEDFKVGMKFKWNDSVFEVLDIHYIDHLVIAKHLDCDVLSAISNVCYEDMEELNPAKHLGGDFTVYQSALDPRKVIARLRMRGTGDLFIGTARCNPEDEFVFDVGATLAIQRALAAKEDYEKYLSTPATTIADILIKSNLKGNKK